MPLLVTRRLRPTSLAELTAAQRDTLLVVAEALWGESLTVEEAYEYDDFGADLGIWIFEEDGVTRYELWGGIGGMDAVLIELDGGPRPAGAGIVQHQLQSWDMHPDRFAAVVAAWERRAETAGVPADADE